MESQYELVNNTETQGKKAHQKVLFYLRDLFNARADHDQIIQLLLPVKSMHKH